MSLNVQVALVVSSEVLVLTTTQYCVPAFSGTPFASVAVSIVQHVPNAGKFLSCTVAIALGYYIRTFKRPVWSGGSTGLQKYVCQWWSERSRARAIRDTARSQNGRIHCHPSSHQ
ncbi:MAG TPA: hypothetical protein VKR56_10580, partial [Candidatus Cybelea sp.]|nr:hypothetical protein [Candidatus Cybelea sp.]